MNGKILKLAISIVIAISAVAVLMVGFGYAASIAVDSFDEGDGSGNPARVCDRSGMDGCQHSLPFPPYVYVEPRLATFDIGAGVLGGERDMVVTQTVGTGDLILRVDHNGNNLMDMAQDPSTGGNGQIQWDGNDSSFAIDTIGLDGVDLTDGGTNDGFQILVSFADGDFDLTVSVFTATNYSTYTLSLVNDVASGQSFFMPFDDFTTAGGTGAVFTETGAVVFDIVPKELGVDLELDLLEATSQTDWGDLPDTYSTTLSMDGARHVITDTTALYLGSQVDLEGNGFPSNSTLGDNDNNFDDEQGVVEAATDLSDNSGWVNGADGGAVRVTVSGGSGCLSGWLDWGENGEFEAANEHIIDHQAVSVGENLITFNVPDNTFGGTAYTYGFYSRFRLYPDTGTAGCGDEIVDNYGSINGGEVEDYYWEYDRPTAITLNLFGAKNNISMMVSAAAALLLVIGMGGMLLAYKRQQ